jgi:glutathione S-transferase
MQRFPELGSYLLPGHPDAPADLPAATGSPEPCARRIADQFAAGADGVILHASLPHEVAPALEAHARIRESARFAGRTRVPRERSSAPRERRARASGAWSPSLSPDWIFRGAGPSPMLCGVTRRAPTPRCPVKLYSGPLSLFTAKVRVALDEKGVAYQRIEVGWSLEHRYQPHHPDVAALNPKGQVPVLVDGDVAVYDSTQIFEYLEERCPTPPLYPSGLAERARCRRLEAWADEILFPHVWQLIDGGFYPAADAASAERREAARRELARLHGELDEQLAGREYLCDRFGVADIGCFIFVSTAATLGAPPDAAHTHLHAWLARSAARPAVKREIEGMQAYVRGLRPARASA